ncbi:MAG: lipopolysaccharide core heptose(I) kinase RfaP [Lentisphaeria bacterium]|nr:lipopolysaccharide core heptose(I) kinase RfaP [Lentisphaeria bacterium]
MTQIELDPFFQALWQGRDPFEEVNKIEGELFRHVKTRKTFRFEAEGRGFFCKIHRGVGWREILKNLFQFKRPVLGAANEFDALRALHAAGIPTMTPAAFGRRGKNPARQESFLITCELENMISCEELAASGVSPQLRRKLIARIAESAGRMHHIGINHCDCYICHYLADKNTLENDPAVYVIDLHRARQRKKVPYHYHIKDTAGLFFSSMDAGLSRRDRLRFMAVYRRVCPECCGMPHFWRDVERTARKLYIKEFGRIPAYQKDQK